MFNPFRRKSRQKPVLTITVTEATGEGSDLEAFGIDNLHPVHVESRGSLCECAQVQILAKLLADVATSKHAVATFGPAAMFAAAPHAMIQEMGLQDAAEKDA